MGIINTVPNKYNKDGSVLHRESIWLKWDLTCSPNGLICRGDIYDKGDKWEIWYREYQYTMASTCIIMWQYLFSHHIIFDQWLKFEEEKRIQRYKLKYIRENQVPLSLLLFLLMFPLRHLFSFFLLLRSFLAMCGCYL